MRMMSDSLRAPIAILGEPSLHFLALNPRRLCSNFANSTAMTACYQCAVGTSQSQLGAAYCNPCRYCDFLGSLLMTLLVLAALVHSIRNRARRRAPIVRKASSSAAQAQPLARECALSNRAFIALFWCADLASKATSSRTSANKSAKSVQSAARATSRASRSAPTAL